MKKVLIIITVLISSQILFGQIAINGVDADLLGENQEKPYAMPGSHHPVLIEKEKKLIEYFEQNPGAKKVPLSKPYNWGFSVGSTYSWWADYFEDPGDGTQQYEVASTCRAVGTNCYVFVEDAVWNSQVTQTAVDAIVEAFDNSTGAQSIDPNKGIFQIDTETFGDPPDVDNDPKIIILILDIQDGWNGSGGYVAGYFYSLNQIADNPGVDGQRSNEAEIFYMDCNPADLINDQTDVLNTTAHEFQHMIHYNWGFPEMTFINEGLSEIASYLCGYGLRSNGLYAQNPNRNLLVWDYDDTLPDYARAALWMLYVYEQFGIDILRDFVVNKHSDWTFIDSRLRSYDNSRGFWNFLREWLITNYVNGYSNDNIYQYQYSPITQSTPVKTYIGNPNGQESNRQIVALGAEYIKFEGGNDLTIRFTGDATIRVWALKLGSLEMEQVTLGQNYIISANDYDDFDEVTFLVYNLTAGVPATYSYTASGGTEAQLYEIAYEDGTYDGAFNLSTGDSVAVLFTGISGAILDSVKTFFSGTGSIQASLTESDGNVNFRGDRLRNDEIINVQNNQAWHKIDLSAENIDGSNDFVVSYLLGNDPSNPNVGVRSMDDTGERHSYTYINGGWLWYFDDRNNSNNFDTGDGIWNYMIRAYLHVGTLAIELDQNGIVTIPEDFSLSANYPNPFNPSTTFDFATPNDGLVKFTVYDLLGQVIFTENRNLFAGKYSFTWDGKNQLDQQVVSGVYFLKMEAEGFMQTRKMLMMK